MNKYKELMKRTAKQGAIFGLISIASMGIYYAISSYVETVQQSKKEVETKLMQDRGLRDNLSAQMAASGEAEKRFMAIKALHPSDNFSGRTEDLTRWLVESKEKYRLAINDKPTSDAEIPSKRPELANLAGYSITERSKLKLQMQAISDLHVFSFIDEMKRTAPGIVRVDMLSLTRNSDMKDATIEGLKSGAMTAPLVTATIEVMLIGVRPKAQKPIEPAAAQGN